MMKLLCISLPLASVLVAATALAQEDAPPVKPKLRVAISPMAPFVLEGQSPRGYSIELWELIADGLGVEHEYVHATGVQAKLDLLRSRKADLAIGGISITSERETYVDFTQPSLSSGLGILVRSDDLSPGLFTRVGSIFTKTKTGIVIAFMVLIVVAGHLVWVAERGRDAFNDKYGPGVLEGMYWAVVTASTVGYGDKAPVRWTGRLLACLVIVISLPMFGIFTAELASAFTVYELASNIRGPEELRSRSVGVLRGTTSAETVSELRLATVQFGSVEALYGGLLDRTVQAVVYDDPALRYYAETDGRGRVAVVGGVFARQNVGFALPPASLYREQINRILLQIAEDGRLDEIRRRWMGDKGS